MPIAVPQQKLLMTLSAIGAFKVDTKKGFKLAIHDTNPTAPLSPFYLNLRTQDNPKPGPLPQGVVNGIGVEICEAAERAHLTFDAICGIPNAGTPFADAMIAHLNRLGKSVQQITLNKGETPSGKRKFSVITSHRAVTKIPRLRVLLVDDLVSTATVKNQAIEAIKRAGHSVAGVAVFLDRRKTGTAKHLKDGIPCVAAVHINDMLEVYEHKKVLSKDDLAAIRRYLAI